MGGKGLFYLLSPARCLLAIVAPAPWRRPIVGSELSGISVRGAAAFASESYLLDAEVGRFVATTVWLIRAQTRSGSMSELGPLSDLGAPNHDVRFAPLNRHRQLEGLRPKSAKTRSLQRLGSCSASSVDVGGSIPSPPTTAGRAMHAYQTSGHLPVAGPHAFVLIRPTSGVGTSAHAICGLILTARRVCHCFCR